MKQTVDCIVRAIDRILFGLTFSSLRTQLEPGSVLELAVELPLPEA